MPCNANVYAMPAPAQTAPCNGSIWAFPSQLHPFVPPSPGGSGGGMPWGNRGDYENDLRDRDLQDLLDEARRREEDDLIALLLLGDL